MHATRFARLIGGFAALCAASVAPLAVAEDAAAVDPVVAQCLACHRADNPAQAVPRIAGQHAEYLRNQLRAFSEQHRDSFPMPAFVAGLDSAQLDDMAARLAALPWTESTVQGDERVAAAGGAELAARYDCASCHGADFRGAGAIARTAGQNQAYLQRQLDSFAGGDRYHPPVGSGISMDRITAQDRRLLAAWLARFDLARLDGEPQSP